MARRRDPGMVSFDVSSDADAGLEGDDGGAPAVAEARPGWWSRAGERWHRADPRQRRLFAGVAGGLAIVLVGGTAVGAAVASHTQTERLRNSPGGVVSLEGELAAVWRVEGGGVPVVLPDGLVVLAEGDDAVALDAGTGEERWRAALGADPVCGPQPRLESGVEWAMPSELVTCLHGPTDERAVTVLDAAGDVVGQRELPGAEYGGEDRDVAPAADGGLLVVEHDTDMPDRLDHATQAGARAAIRRVDPEEARVHVEDAVTGDVRFEVPTGAPSGRLLDECAFVWDRSDGSFPRSFDQATPFRIEVSPPRTLVASPALVGYQWCDVGGATTTTGAVLVESTGEDAVFLGGVAAVEAYSADRFVVPSQDPASGEIGSDLVGADGSVLLESPTRQVATPGASVDADESVVLATDGFGQALTGLDPAGEELWRLDHEAAGVLARAGDVAVVAGNEDLVGVDVTDGTERWRVAMSAPEGRPYAWPTSAVTDGDRVTVALTAVTGDDDQVGELLTVDLATGTARRERLGAGTVPYLAAVDGHLLLQELTVPPDSWVEEADLTSVSVLAPR
ncbi:MULTISPECIES: outer membrane protein assembly factor BamB family protein [Isoptericola]|nr:MULTISPECIES: PQQ-binding-like beta-propeller repeat protein [Isoptericola]